MAIALSCQGDLDWHHLAHASACTRACVSGLTHFPSGQGLEHHLDRIPRTTLCRRAHHHLAQNSHKFLPCRYSGAAWQLQIQRTRLAHLDSQCGASGGDAQSVGINRVAKVSAAHLVPGALRREVDLQLLGSVAEVELLHMGQRVSAIATKLGGQAVGHGKGAYSIDLGRGDREALLRCVITHMVVALPGVGAAAVGPTVHSVIAFAGVDRVRTAAGCDEVVTRAALHIVNAYFARGLLGCRAVNGVVPTSSVPVNACHLRVANPVDIGRRHHLQVFLTV